MSTVTRIPGRYKPLPFVCENGHTYEALAYYDGAVLGWLAVEEDGECPECEDDDNA